MSRLHLLKTAKHLWEFSSLPKTMFWREHKEINVEEMQRAWSDLALKELAVLFIAKGNPVKCNLGRT